jgi:hypothetical protein
MPAKKGLWKFLTGMRSYEDTEEFLGDRDHILRSCVDAISQCGFRVMGSNEGTGLIAQARMSSRSWGEVINVDVSEKGAVHIRSACTGVPFQLVDFGKNRDNVNAIFSALEEFLPRPPYQEAPAEPHEGGESGTGA